MTDLFLTLVISGSFLESGISAVFTRGKKRSATGLEDVLFCTDISTLVFCFAEFARRGRVFAEHGPPVFA